MSDTQWPRFMVFHKMNEEKPYIHNGTVHAPDVDMALLNARDVFGRRPYSVGMFVVLADNIFSKTIEEIEAGWGKDIKIADEPGETYLVYGKLSHQAQCEEIGNVNASTSMQAMKKGIEEFPDKKILMWWVFPEKGILSSNEEDAASMFDWAEEHEFKNQANYPVITMMRQIKKKGKLED